MRLRNPVTNEDQTSLRDRIRTESHQCRHHLPFLRERARTKLRKDMDEFVRKLAEKDFAARCTVTQLVQAVAYPLAVTANETRGGWIDAMSDAEDRAAVEGSAIHSGAVEAFHWCVGSVCRVWHRTGTRLGDRS
jgi:hypothetical protein